MPNLFKTFKVLICPQFDFSLFVKIGFHAKYSGILFTVSLATLSFHVYYIMPDIFFCYN